MPTTMAAPAPDRPVLIHPGFHKTGTTFLQNIVFTDPRLFRRSGVTARSTGS